MKKLLVAISIAFGFFLFVTGFTDPNTVGLGIRSCTVDSEVREIWAKNHVPLPQVNGVLILEVYGNGPAEKTNLKKSDLIYRVNGMQVLNSKTLTSILQKTGTEQKILVQYLRPTEVQNTIKWEYQKVYVQPMAFRDIYGGCPLNIQKAWISENAIDEPVLNMKLFNIGDSNITAYCAEIFCFNKFDEPVLGLNRTNRVSAIGQETTRIGEQIVHTITLHFRETVGKVKIVITRLKFENGEEWKYDPNNITFYIAEK
jgi:hypothetical protein